MDFSLLIIVFLIAIIFILDGFKDGMWWLFIGSITVLLISLLYYFSISIFPLYGKMVFGCIVIISILLLKYIKRI